VEKLKNIIILIICVQITIPFVVEDCLRFPVLVSHFLHHNNHHEKINFSHFVSEHYSEKHHDENHDENHDKHENLPFQKHCDYSFNHILGLNLEIVLIKFQTNYNFKEPKKIAFKQNCFQSNVSLNIWKPPKIS